MFASKDFKFSLTKKFILFVFLGAFLIYFLSKNSLEMSLLLRASGPIFLMVFYAWFARPKKIEGILPGYNLIYANSIYYIGFIYTLLALAISTFLLQKNEEFSIKNEDVFLILGNFGVGLTTTIFGFSYRAAILFSNINDRKRSDEDEAVANDNDGVLFYLKDISSQLVETHNEQVKNSNELTILFRKMLKSVKAEDIFSMHESVLEKLSDNYTDVLVKNQSILESVEEKSKNFFDKYDELLKPNIEASANSFKNLSAVLDSVKDAAIEAENALKVLTVNSQKVSNKYANYLAPSIEETASNFKGLNVSLIAIKSAMDSIVTIEKEIVASATATTSRLKEGEKSIVSSMEGLNNSMQKQIEKSSMFDEYFDAADSLGGKVVSALKELEIRIRGLHEKIKLNDDELDNLLWSSAFKNWIKKVSLLFKKNNDNE